MCVCSWEVDSRGRVCGHFLGLRGHRPDLAMADHSGDCRPGRVCPWAAPPYSALVLHPRRALAPRGGGGSERHSVEGPAPETPQQAADQREGRGRCFRQTPSFSSALAPAAGLMVVAASASVSPISPSLKACKATGVPPCCETAVWVPGLSLPHSALGTPPSNGDSSPLSGWRKV